MEGKKTRVVAITGAGQGIGRAIAEKFAKNGADLAIIDVKEENAQKAAAELGKFGINVIAYCCDVSDEKQVEEVLKKIANDFGHLDVLVNNAGILMRGFIEDFTVEDLNKILGVNLFGVYNCCRAAVKVMKPQKSGVILNATSVVNKQYDIGMAGYCISKRAVEVLTKILAAEVAPYGIRVNGYSPGTTETPMTAHLIQTRGETKVKQIPAGRFGDPRDLAEAVYFLASEAAGHITGTILEVDGGELIVQRPHLAWEKAKRGCNAE